MKLYCGIDLHANNSVISVIDEKDAIVYERRHRNDLPAILGALEPFQDALLACVVESTYNWYWLVDGLMDAGFDVRLAHTGAIPQYAGIKHSNDQTDARHLAHLLRLGILPEGHIQPREQRAIRDLLRRRLLLVRQKTLHHLSLQSLIVRQTGERLSANQIKALDNDAIADKLADPIRLGGQITHLARRWHEHAIALLEDEVLKHLQPRQEYQLLNSIPGVGKILASTIVLETGVDRALPRSRAVRLVRTLRQYRTDQQWQAQGSRQQAQRQQIPGLGFHGGGALCRHLEPGDQAVLSEAPGETAHPGGQEDRGE